MHNALEGSTVPLGIKLPAVLTLMQFDLQMHLLKAFS